MAKHAIEVSNLSKRYRIGTAKASYRTLREAVVDKFSPNEESKEKGHIWALKDIDFTVEPGESIGIIGRNGAGKSTLLKILSRITKPTRGRAKLNGRVGSLLEVGTGFHPELTGRENIYLNGAILGMKRTEIERKFDEIVEFSGIEKFLDTPVKRYSSGMYVRLAFSVAAHLEPEILLVDEVLSVGDAEFQKKCLGKMESISRQGRTVLFVSHNLSAIQDLTDTVVILNSGEISFTGTTEDGISQYYRDLDIFENDDEFTYSDDLLDIVEFNIKAKKSKCWYNSPLSFKLYLDIKKSVSNIYISIGIQNSLSSRLIKSWAESVPVKIGENQLLLSIKDHHLPPGKFFVTLGLKYAGNHKRFDKALSINLDNEGYLHRRFSKQKDIMGTYIPLSVNNKEMTAKYIIKED